MGISRNASELATFNSTTASALRHLTSATTRVKVKINDVVDADIRKKLEASERFLKPFDWNLEAGDISGDWAPVMHHGTVYNASSRGSSSHVPDVGCRYWEIRGDNRNLITRMEKMTQLSL